MNIKTNHDNSAEINESLTKLTDTLAQFPDVVEKIVSSHTQPELAPPFYDARGIALPTNSIVEVFGYDATRIRFVLKASDSATILIGNRDTVDADNGYPITDGNLIEFHTVQPVYAKTSDSNATLYLWAEYRSR